MVDWVDRYVGLPYVDGVFDCTHLVGKVQEEVFGRQIPLPTDREPTTFGLSAQVDRHKEDYFVKLNNDEVEDGDVVIMRCKGRLNHIGVYFDNAGTRYVLHNLKNVGAVVAHRLRDLDRINIQLEGFYRFRSISDIEQRIHDK